MEKINYEGKTFEVKSSKMFEGKEAPYNTETEDLIEIRCEGSSVVMYEKVKKSRSEETLHPFFKKHIELQKR